MPSARTGHGRTSILARQDAARLPRCSMILLSIAVARTPMERCLVLELKAFLQSWVNVPRAPKLKLFSGLSHITYQTCAHGQMCTTQ